jgi:hypothetical protein
MTYELITGTKRLQQSNVAASKAIQKMYQNILEYKDKRRKLHLS